jgi:hypothetical protein
MNNDKERNAPKENPVRKNSDKSDPLKDPLHPNETNPINPKTDEPT